MPALFSLLSTSNRPIDDLLDPQTISSSLIYVAIKVALIMRHSLASIAIQLITIDGTKQIVEFVQLTSGIRLHNFCKCHAIAFIYRVAHEFIILK
jgi:hypothetical protein